MVLSVLYWFCIYFSRALVIGLCVIRCVFVGTMLLKLSSIILYHFSRSVSISSLLICSCVVILLISSSISFLKWFQLAFLNFSVGGVGVVSASAVTVIRIGVWSDVVRGSGFVTTLCVGLSFAKIISGVEQLFPL